MLGDTWRVFIDLALYHHDLDISYKVYMWTFSALINTFSTLVNIFSTLVHTFSTLVIEDIMISLI